MSGDGGDDGFWEGEAAPGSDARVVVDVSTLDEGRTRLFSFRRDGEVLSGIVVRWGGALHAYVNRCPHIRLSLDYGDGNVWDRDGRAFLCTMHGALFEPGTGVCFVGPPRGRALERLPIAVDGDLAVVEITPEPADWPRRVAETDLPRGK